MSDSIRILVVDDHPIVRDGLLAILNTQPDFEVVGEAGDGIQALARAKLLMLDVILLDLEMPQLDGVATLRRLAQEGSRSKVIVFTAFDTDERILAAVQAGASGYLLKGVPRQELFSAIRIVHAGGSLLKPVVASKLMRQVRRGPQEPEESLTPREHEALTHLARGLQNKEIAAALDITERTVKFQVSAILGKLEAGNRTEAAAIGAQRGVVELDRN